MASNLSGPVLSQLIHTTRNGGGKVEAPDQVLSFQELAEVHAPWYVSSVGAHPEDEDPLVLHGRIRVDSNPMNFHVVIDSQLYNRVCLLVPRESLSLGDHDEDQTVEVVAVAPGLHGGLGFVPVAQHQQMLLNVPRAAEELVRNVPRGEAQPVAAQALVAHRSAGLLL